MNAQSGSDILSSLDAEQLEAATTLKGPVRIIAGPGSGKTRTVSHRIAHGIATGHFNPQKVLALTYTNRAAAELRQRLRSLGASSVQVRTFHAAALSQLQYFWPQLTGSTAPKLLTSKRAILKEAVGQKVKLTEAQLSELSSEFEYLRYSLSDLPAYFLSGRLPRFADEEKFSQWFDNFQALKKERRLIDWEDALLLCTGMLRNEPRAMSHFEQQYRHFTVDEYQDISPLQQGLLETWLGDREEVCVVGDPRQNIYSFAGSSTDFLLGFDSRYPNSSSFELTTNYRSAGDIVEAANGLFPDQPIVAAKKVSGLISQQTLPTAAEEARVVAEAIAKATGSSKLSRIAVLARINSQLEAVESELRSLGVETQVRGQGRFFRQPNVMQALSAIRALALSELTQPLFVEVSNILSSLGWSSRGEGRSWAELNWFIEVMDELGDPSLEELIRELDERARSGHEPQREAVTLATIHATKGLEWERVFLIGVNDGLYPISHAKTKEQLEEEKRLFYVAITRAETYLDIFSTGKVPSPFIEHLHHSRKD